MRGQAVRRRQDVEAVEDRPAASPIRDLPAASLPHFGKDHAQETKRVPARLIRRS